MLYLIPDENKNINWPAGTASVSAKLEDGTPVQVPVLADASQLVLGTTHYGKTTYIKKVTRGILEADPETLAVIRQVKPDDFTSEFYCPGDKIISYDQLDFSEDAIFHWNLIKEIRHSLNAEAEIKRMSSSFFAPLLEDKKNLVWAGAARDTFSAYLKVIIYCYADCPSNGAVIGRLRDMSLQQLLSFLAKHPANHSLLKKSYGFDPSIPVEKYKPPRKAEDILFFLNHVLEMWHGESFASFKGTDTIAEFLSGSCGRHLFLQDNISQTDVLKPFQIYFLRKIIEDKLSPGTNYTSPVLLVLDEADKIGGDFNLKARLLLGLGFGLKTIVGSQSFEALFVLSPMENREHETNSLISGFPVITAFHGGDSNTNQMLQKLFGSVYQKSISLSPSRYSPPVVSYQLQPLVTDLDLASLDTGEAFVKIRSHPPIKVRFDK